MFKTSKAVKFLIIPILIFGFVFVFNFESQKQENSNNNNLLPIKEALAKSNENADYNLSSIVVLTRVISYIKNYYYDPGRIDAQAMFKKALEEVARSIPSVMVKFDEQAKRVDISLDTKMQSFGYDDINTVWKIQYRISDIFSFIQPHLNKDIDPKDIEYAAINGMLDSLDPHSVLLTPKIFRELELSTRGNFGGLGIQIGIREGNLTIVAPILDTPAWRAGLKAKDHIQKIDGQSTINMGLDEAVQLMRGKEGTPCTLTIMRKSFSDPKEFTIVRDIIKIRSVHSKLLPGRIAYLRVANYQGNTVKDMKSHIKKMRQQGPLNGLVLDLRGNPGGLLESAIDMSNLFLDAGVIVTTVGVGNKRLEVNEASFIGTEPKYPIAVLVGSASASASEIVAGALKNNSRAVIIGDVTFGKGSVQVLYKMDDGSALKLTIAQYLTPGDVSIQSVGITPDIELTPVFFSEDIVEFYSSDEMRREKDLNKHLEHKSTIKEKPFEQLYYLYDEKRDEVDIDSPPETVNTDDYATQFAYNLLKNVKTLSRREIILQRSISFMKEQSKKEEQKIVKEFKKQKVDWKSQKSTGKSTVEISITTDKKDVFKAGEDVNFTLKVKNTGKHVLSRLRAITDCDYYVFGGFEFFIGKLAPGKSKSWTTKVTIPKDALTREGNIAFKFHEENGNQPDNHEMMFKIEETPKPAFAYTFQIVEQKGNGDGLIQKGEVIDLLLDIENSGNGDVTEGLATLKNSDNLKPIFIETGRSKFEKLKAGNRHLAKFTFRVGEDLNQTEFPMNLAIIDMDLRVYTTDKINFHVQSPLKYTKTPKGSIVVADAGLTVFGSPDERLPIIAKITKKQNLVVKAISGRWAKVVVDKKRTGWIFGTSEWKTKVKGASKTLKILMSRQTPKIKVDESKIKLYTDLDKISVIGKITDDNHVQDMYILNNGKKVYFKSNLKGKTALKMDFDALIELEEGTNRILIVGRESEDFTGRKTLIIYKKKQDKAISQIEKGEQK